MAAGSSHKPVTIYGAIISNVIIAVAKFVAALISGSSAMLAEGIHSVIDTGNELLLLWGVHRSRKPPDDVHPFGHGKELYFWSLIVAVLLFGIGGGMSVLEGIVHLRHPAEMGDPKWNYIVLSVAFLAEGTSWLIALKTFLTRKGDRKFFRALHRSKDPGVFIVLLEDSAALAGILVAFLGVFLHQQFGLTYSDGLASVIIGLILATVAGFLAYESKSLLLGESADSALIQSIREIARSEPSVEGVRRPLTMHLGPDQVLLAVGIEFSPKLAAADVAQVVDRLEEDIRRKHPIIKRIFIEAESLREPEPVHQGR